MIYCVEDDASIRELVLYTLRASGFEARGFAESGAFWAAMREHVPDLVLLDIMLPGEDGLEILKKLRSSPLTEQLPVILATARGSEYDKVVGLDTGADDYLVKPFSFDELLARLRVITRKRGGSATNVFSVADLTVDTASHHVTRGGRTISLSAKEFALLEYMIRNRGIVLSRERIENHLWNYDYSGGSNVVDVYVSYLRRKIDADYPTKLIHTVWGVGWVLREEV